MRSVDRHVLHPSHPGHLHLAARAVQHAQECTQVRTARAASVSTCLVTNVSLTKTTAHSMGSQYFEHQLTKQILTMRQSSNRLQLTVIDAHAVCLLTAASLEWGLHAPLWLVTPSHTPLNATRCSGSQGTLPPRHTYEACFMFLWMVCRAGRLYVCD